MSTIRDVVLYYATPYCYRLISARWLMLLLLLSTFPGAHFRLVGPGNYFFLYIKSPPRREIAYVTTGLVCKRASHCANAALWLFLFTRQSSELCAHINTSLTLRGATKGSGNQHGKGNKPGRHYEARSALWDQHYSFRQLSVMQQCLKYI